MKKIIFLLSILLIPVITNAKELTNASDVEITKYYKTVTTYHNNQIEPLSLNNLSYNVEISEEEYENYNENLSINIQSIKTGYTETNYKKMITTATKKNKDIYTLKVTLEWKTMPATRSYDIIGIGFPTSVTAINNVSFVQKYCLNNGNCGQYTNYALYKGANGVGASFALPTDNLSSLSQVLIIDIKKSNSNNTLTSLKFSGDYSHAQKAISQVNSKKFSVDSSGIVLESSITNYYDSINSAVAVWNGTW